MNSYMFLKNEYGFIYNYIVILNIYLFFLNYIYFFPLLWQESEAETGWDRREIFIFNK